MLYDRKDQTRLKGLLLFLVTKYKKRIFIWLLLSGVCCCLVPSNFVLVHCVSCCIKKKYLLGAVFSMPLFFVISPTAAPYFYACFSDDEQYLVDGLVLPGKSPHNYTNNSNFFNVFWGRAGIMGRNNQLYLCIILIIILCNLSYTPY